MTGIDKEMAGILGRLNEQALMVKSKPKARGALNPLKGLKWIDLPSINARIYGKTIAEAEAKAQATLDAHNKRHGSQWTIAMTESFKRGQKRGAAKNAATK